MILPTKDRGHASTDNEICLHERYAPTTFQDSFTHFFTLKNVSIDGIEPTTSFLATLPRDQISL